MAPKDPKTILTDEELQVLLKHYDRNKDQKLSEEEIAKLVDDCVENPETVPEEVKRVLKKYDTDGNGKIDKEEVQALVHDVHLADGKLRYAGYSAAFARLFRYLAFTSDVGEALRPVASARLVTATYAVAFGYCGVDVAYEAYKVHKNGNKNDKGHPTTVTQVIVERSVFQAVASLALPAFIIHSAVDVAKHAFKRVGKFQKWGPSVVGLACIPLLPMYLDEPVEHAIEWGFARYGPWATNKKGDKQH